MVVGTRPGAGTVVYKLLRTNLRLQYVFTLLYMEEPTTPKIQFVLVAMATRNVWLKMNHHVLCDAVISESIVPG